MRPDLPTGTVTLLFTDLEGSTKLLRTLGPAAYGAALAEHRRLLREAFAAHGGVEVDTQGDAFFVAFPTAPGASAAAAVAQAALALGSVSVRMGLHTGSPTVTGEGYVGIDVHRGARVAHLAHGGQVLLSEATASLLEPSEAVAAVLDRDPRVLTIVGPGGTGKTRFAIELARLLAEDADGGTVFVPLAALRDPELLLQTLAEALGAESASSPPSGSPTKGRRRSYGTRRPKRSSDSERRRT